MSVNLVELSKEASYALRHAPWEYELELDEQGFVPIEQLIAALNEGGKYCRPIVRSDLEEIIAKSDKKRHEIDGDRIRALYGHSVPMRILKEKACPPATLYHGTAHTVLDAILREGLKPMGRQYVHLSADIETALRVGRRKDAEPILLKVDAGAAFADGLPFFVGNDMVWLADNVPPSYLSIMSACPNAAKS